MWLNICFIGVYVHCKKWGVVLHLIGVVQPVFSEHQLNVPFAAKLFHLGSCTYIYLTDIALCLHMVYSFTNLELYKRN